MKILATIPVILFSISSFAAEDYSAKHTIVMNNYVAAAHTNVSVTATIFNQFTNNTNERVHIMARYNLYIEGCGNDKHQWDIWVSPHATWHDQWRPMKECRFAQGNYRVDAQGAIEGLNVPFNNEKWATGTISVR
jgi:hypothetical protein